MRPRAIACGAFAFALGASLVACIDLFHGTDFESACDLDASACGAVDASVGIDATPPPQDAGSDAPTDFCQWIPTTAAAYAVHACAWLGACEGALGDDAFAPCMLHAMLAYDCAANPNRPVLGAAHAYWDCLWQVQTCGDVDHCVEPSGTHETCADDDAGYVACDPEAGTLVACAADLANGSPPTAVESCVPLGQTCSPSGVATCIGSATPCADVGTSCEGTALHDCDPDGGPTDYGVDCASFGSGSCVGSGACGAVDGGSCTPTTDVTCDGGLAMGCPSGTTEQVDCNAVLGQPSATTTCDETAPGRPWDVSRACSMGTCQTGDSCGTDGKTLLSCTRGASVSIDCTLQGFTRCVSLPYPHCANDAGD